MKNFRVSFSVLLIAIFLYVPFSFGYTMADYWALKEGSSLVFDRELIVSGPQTHTFGGYTGRELLQGTEFRGENPYTYTSSGGVLVVGFYSNDMGDYLDLSANPIVMAAGQMNTGDSVTSVIPPGTLDPGGSITVNVALVNVESVTVPAGSFSNCLKLQVTVQETQGTFVENIWLAKDVGPVQIYRASETNGSDGCFLSCGSLDDDTGQVVNRYIKLKGYYLQGSSKVVVIPLVH